MSHENQELKRVGLKATLPRVRILELLEHSEQRHLSAEDVYKLLLGDGNDIGLATVYRVLTQFEGVGLVVRHHFDGGTSVFELNDGEHHDHLVCVRCGRVEEFHDETIESRQQSIAKERGWSITGHSLYIYGYPGSCPDCKLQGKT